MLRVFRADLHIHTCLSPCGELSMSPKKIIQRALEKKIDIIAISDHNSVENVPALIEAARDKPLTVVPGMEICTREEIHVLALFEKLDMAFEVQSRVYANLFGENNPDVFGMQVVGNAQDEVIGFNTKLLIGATELPIEKVIEKIHSSGGITIASHIDRESYSIIGQLGFIPEAMKLDALEISPAITIDDARKQYPNYTQYPFIQNSDAHSIEQIGVCTTEYLLESPTFSELVMALKNIDGRKVKYT